jgi:hypothetical protein
MLILSSLASGGKAVAVFHSEAQKRPVLLHKSSRENGFETRPYSSNLLRLIV